MQEIVRLGVDRSIQPELLAVDSDHRLVERNVIRTRVAGRLQIGLVNPVVDRFLRPFDTKLLHF